MGYSGCVQAELRFPCLSPDFATASTWFASSPHNCSPPQLANNHAFFQGFFHPTQPHLYCGPPLRFSLWSPRSILCQLCVLPIPSSIPHFPLHVLCASEWGQNSSANASNPYSLRLLAHCSISGGEEISCCVENVWVCSSCA